MPELCMLSLLEHSSECEQSNCGRAIECSQFKQLLQMHVTGNGVKCIKMKCVVCKQMKSLINEHSKKCVRDQCPVPTCNDLRALPWVCVPTKEDLQYNRNEERRLEGQTLDFDSTTKKTTSDKFLKNVNGHLEETIGVAKKQRAPYKCGSCGQVKGNSHKCTGSIFFLDGVATVTSFYDYDDMIKPGTAKLQIKEKKTTSSVSSATVSCDAVTTEILSVSVTDSSEDDDEVVTLPSTDSSGTLSTSCNGQYSKDAVAKFNRKVKLKAREDTKLMRKLRKSALSRRSSTNYISDSSSSSRSSDSFDTREPRRGIDHLIAGSPMWGSMIHKLDRNNNASVPCETTIDPRMFSPFVSFPQQRQSQSISIFDAKGRVMDMQFDNECKFLQCFDDVDLL